MVDSAGATYVADSQNQRVRKIPAAGIIINVLGSSPSTGLLTSTAVAVDPSGTIYVGDQRSWLARDPLLKPALLA